MSASALISRLLIGAAWAAAATAAVPVVHTLRGDFNADRPPARASGIVRRLDAATPGEPVRLDSATALVLIYSPTCSACTANTDNWVRLGAEVRAEHPGMPIIVIAAPRDSLGRPLLPTVLRSAFSEYAFTAGSVESGLGVRIVPATVALRRGRIGAVMYGVIGPRRRAKVVAAFGGAAT